MHRFRKILFCCIGIYIVFLAAKCDAGDNRLSMREVWVQDIGAAMRKWICDLYTPNMQLSGQATGVEWIAMQRIASIVPIYYFPDASEDERDGMPFYEHTLTYREVVSNHTFAPNVESEDGEDAGGSSPADPDDVLQAPDASFVRHEDKTEIADEKYRDYQALLKNFYTVDANTQAGEELLDYEKFMRRDFSIEKGEKAPGILIYHTHSQEAFADSLPGDPDTSVVGVGERLAENLRGYGYCVLHDTQVYDLPDRDSAYARALPSLERILKENPSIEVLIDLHRDEMPKGQKQVLDLDGRQTARFMFFNGLSRTNKTGEIAYLKNENIDANLAFSFQMQMAAESYYPGLARKIYLKGYRYNLHLKERSLLVELGSQNNTVEEAMNACDPLAHILDIVLGQGV